MKPVQAVQKAAIRLIGSIGKMKVRGLPRGLVIVLMLLIVGSAVLYLAGWGWIWAVGGRPDLPALNQLLQTLMSALRPPFMRLTCRVRHLRLAGL